MEILEAFRSSVPEACYSTRYIRLRYPPYRDRHGGTATRKLASSNRNVPSARRLTACRLDVLSRDMLLGVSVVTRSAENAAHSLQNSDCKPAYPKRELAVAE